MAERPSVEIRDVADADMEAIRDIYADEVLTGVSSWEYEAPSLGEMIRRRDAIRDAGYPYRVADLGGRVLGYAYASAYRPRPGYRYTVENSIYVSAEARGNGTGRALLEDLIGRCADLGFRQMVAVIGDSKNLPSIDFHRRMGFTEAGTIRSIGFKFGRWMDSVVMQLPLGDGDDTLP